MKEVTKEKLSKILRDLANENFIRVTRGAEGTPHRSHTKKYARIPTSYGTIHPRRPSGFKAIRKALRNKTIEVPKIVGRRKKGSKDRAKRYR